MVHGCQDFPALHNLPSPDATFYFNVLGIMGLPGLAIQALGLTIRHLKQFGLERILCLESSFRPLSTKMEMTLSANALQQLEVTGDF